MYNQSQQQQQQQHGFVYPTGAVTATRAYNVPLNELNPMNFGQIFCAGNNVYGADYDYAYPPTPNTPIQTSPSSLAYNDPYQHYVQQQQQPKDETKSDDSEPHCPSPSHSADTLLSSCCVEGEEEQREAEDGDGDEGKMILLLDWDDTLFPTTWINEILQSRDNNDLCMVHDDQIDALNQLGNATLSLLTSLIGKYGRDNIHIVTNSLEGWISESLSYAACISKIYQQIQDFLTAHRLTMISAQSSYAQKDNKESTPLLWKQLCFDDIFASSVSQSANKSRRRYSHIVSIGDQWTDHCAVQKTQFAQQAHAPIHHIVKLKMSPTLNDMTNEIRYISTCFAQIFDVICLHHHVLANTGSTVKPVIIDYETEEMKLYYKNITTHFNVNLNVNVNVNINK